MIDAVEVMLDIKLTFNGRWLLSVLSCAILCTNPCTSF
jgi:hypothetical protein